MPNDSAKMFETVNATLLALNRLYPFSNDPKRKLQDTISALFAERDAQAKLIHDFQQAELAWQSGEHNAKKIIDTQAERIRSLEEFIVGLQLDFPTLEQSNGQRVDWDWINENRLGVKS